jgi:hypothetical protein
MPLLEHGATVQVVGLGTAITPIDGQLAFARAPEMMRLRYRRTTARAPQAIGMEMLQKPAFALFGVEEISYWKFHGLIIRTSSLFQ